MSDLRLVSGLTRPLLAWLVLTASLARANTIVPANELGALLNAYLFPLVVLVEWLVYRAHRLDRPFRGALVLNLVTSAMGLAFVVLAGGIASRAHTIGGVVAQALVFPLLHFLVTLATEQGLNRLLHRAKPWPFKAVLRANAVTYGAIMGLNAILSR